MFRGLVISAGKLRADLSQHRSPGKIALGLAMGCTLGLLPMDNLVWAILFVAVLFLPVHQLGAFSAWVVVGLTSRYLSAVPEAIGEGLLNWESVRGLVVQCHQLPLGAWFRLNNTLVLGSLVCGVTAVIPAWIAIRSLARQSDRKGSDPIFYGVDESLPAYRKVVLQTPRERTPAQPTSTATSDIDTDTVPAVVAQSNLATGMATGTVPGVAAESGAPKAKVLRIDARHRDSDSRSDESYPQDEVTIRETFIEVIRLRATQPHLPLPNNEQSNTMILESQKSELLVPASDELVLSSASAEANTASSETTMARLSPPHQILAGPKSSNSLRFLLRHLTSHRCPQKSSESESRGTDA